MPRSRSKVEIKEDNPTSKRDASPKRNTPEKVRIAINLWNFAELVLKPEDYTVEEGDEFLEHMKTQTNADLFVQMTEKIIANINLPDALEGGSFELDRPECTARFDFVNQSDKSGGLAGLIVVHNDREFYFVLNAIKKDNSL